MRIVVLALLLVSSIASADELSQLRGRVLDRTTGQPVAGALVIITGADGVATTVNTDRHGHYAVALRPGTYKVIFTHGRARESAQVTLGVSATLDGKLDAMLGEVIVIREKITPPVPPKPKNYKPRKAPPYSDTAVLADAWTKAHMLLDVDERGVVRRYKFLKRPGYDLERIAVSEVTKLTFEPARDRSGKPIRAWVVWTIEWPSAWWLQKLVGTRSAMPPVVGFPPRRLDAYVPCRGSGPMNLGSVHPTYKDCSKPDLRNAAREAWVTAR